LERGRKKEAELRKEVEEATQEGDEVRASILSEIRSELIRELTLRDLRSIYEVEKPTPTGKVEASPSSSITRLEDPSREEPRNLLFALSENRSPSQPSGVDGYTGRLLKYIPAECVALYLTLQGIILSATEGLPPTLWLWVIFGIGLVATPIYLWAIAEVWKPIQLVVSTVAFGIWVFALGGAFASLLWYEPFIGSLVLVTFTFFAPLINPDSA
jgi:hypothetical protein